MFQSKDAVHSIKGFKTKEKKKFPCEKCGIMFTGHKTLQNHKKARHCDKCQDAFVSPKVLVEHLLSKHGEVRVPRFRGGTVSQKGPGLGEHSTAPNRPPVSNPSSPDPILPSQPSREDGPSTQQSDPAAEVPMETSQPQGSQEPLLMETS